MHPDKAYISYFDVRTLSCLFLTSAVVTAFKNINFFYDAALKILSAFKSFKTCILFLVSITFLGSMLLANDIALITFLPLGYYLLKISRKEEQMAFVFIMQNIAANLGGMLTPFGNPQNLYLFSKFGIPVPEFTRIMLPSFLLSIISIFIITAIVIKSDKMQLDKPVKKLINKRTLIYFALFAGVILAILRIVPYWIFIIIVPVVLLLTDKKALSKTDYGLLLTFVFFFVLTGNLARIDAVKNILSVFLDKVGVLAGSSLCCQFISNVPSAILLSGFTNNYRELLIGVNIGGCGTLIASLASLITFREYVKHNPKGKLKYIGKFSVLNFGFLGALLLFNSLAL